MNDMALAACTSETKTKCNRQFRFQNKKLDKSARRRYLCLHSEYVIGNGLSAALDTKANVN